MTSEDARQRLTEWLISHPNQTLALEIRAALADAETLEQVRARVTLPVDSDSQFASGVDWERKAILALLGAQ